LQFLLFLPLVMACGGMMVELLAVATGNRAVPRPAWLLAGGTALIHAAVLLLVHRLLRAHEWSWGVTFGWVREGRLRRWGMALLLTLPALVVAWFLHQAASAVLSRLGVTVDAQAAVEAVREAARPMERLMFFAVAALSAPWVEETVFRGVLWPLIRDRGWGWLGWVGLSGLFALIHANAAAFLPLFVLSLFWTWMYERTRDLAVPILSHALFNTVNFVTVLALPAAPVSG
jgi:membrane protease YdiL (CAAX protease family)